MLGETVGNNISFIQVHGYFISKRLIMTTRSYQ